MANSLSNFIVSILYFSIVLLLFCRFAVSHSIIKTLPGFNGDLPFLLETGYIGVGEKEEVQLFYYFIESERNPENDPLLLWLTGGPGCSALSGLLYEIGPLKFNYLETKGNKPVIELNPNGWTKVSSIIFVDTPVGTGFSYATTSEGYNVNDTITASELHEFLRKWLVDHPKFLANSLYIAGDSYSGMIVPIVVQEILNGNEMGVQPLLNLKGYSLGNPLTDYKIDFNAKVTFAYQHALLSKTIYESFMKNCRGEYLYPDLSNALCMEDIKTINECIGKIYRDQILEPYCSKLSPKPAESNWKPIASKWNPIALSDSSNDIQLSTLQVPVLWCLEYDYVYAFSWANDRIVREALGIREGTKKQWMRCNFSLADSYQYNVFSVIDYHRNFTNTGLQALIYSGDHDMVIPYVGTTTWIESLNLTVASEWQPWFVNGQVAGYTIQYKNKGYRLTYATVKGGGHTAPQYKPKECLAMIDRWLAYYPL